MIGEAMETKPIFNSYIAKQLLNKGNHIVDIQPDKMRRNAVVFYFEITDKLREDLKKISHKQIN